MTTCTVCTRPVGDQAYACRSCADRLARALGDVDAVARDLAISYSRRARGGDAGDKTRRGSERALPWDERASAAVHRLRSTLVTWARIVAEERGLDLDIRNSPAAVAAWLLAHGNVEWLRHHRAVGEALEQIEGAVHDARRVVDRRADLWFAGPCSGPPVPDAEPGVEYCGRDLWARPDAAQVECPACHTAFDVADRRSWLLAAAQDHLAHAELIGRALTVLGVDVSPAMIRGYVFRGRIVAHGVDLAGRELYRVGDVLEVARQALAARATRPAGRSARRAAAGE